MSVKIAGATTNTEQEVDTVPKAGRVILYDSAGNPLQPSPTYEGVALINVRQSAATAPAAAVWAIYNSHATRIVSIKSLLLQMFFDGTAAATLMRYELVKYTGVTAFSGGSVVTPSHKRSSLSGAQVSQVRVLDTGLTLTSGTAQAAAWNGVQGRVTQTTGLFSSTVVAPPVATPGATLVPIGIELAQNEALAIRQVVTSVIGDNIIGACEFFER